MVSGLDSALDTCQIRSIPVYEVLQKWRENQCYKEVLVVCLPLVIGMSATTVMEFTDRVFLSNYSLEAISAATPAGITAFLFMAIFGGIGSYCGVFIAQYYGSAQPGRIGAVLWQGMYFCLVAGILLLLIAQFFPVPFFNLVGHDEEVRRLEVIYFTILCRGAIFHVAAQTLSAFFSGRGLTRTVMAVNIIGMVVNIPLDYALIFGFWVFPELGITGAGYATVLSTGLTALILAVLIFTKKHDDQFGVFRQFSYDHPLMMRLLRFGIPGSMQFSLDILAFTFFILIVGRVGVVELAATNIALSINAIAFMPSMGVSHGVAVLVGQALGRKAPVQAVHATWSAVHLLLLYIVAVGVLFIVWPETIIALFIPADGGADYGPVIETGVVLMRIVACYLLFDALYMVFSGVLKGAGDTRFIMWSIAGAATFCFILPLYVGIELLGKGVYYSWGCVLFFILTLFGLTAFRYGAGRWKSMLVIDTVEAELADPGN